MHYIVASHGHQNRKEFTLFAHCSRLVAVGFAVLLVALSGAPAGAAPATFRGVHADSQITGTFTQGGRTFTFHLGREQLVPPRRPREPKRPLPYREEEVGYENGPIHLAATLTLPEGAGPFPAADFADDALADSALRGMLNPWFRYDVTVRRLAGLNHVLQRAKTGNPDEYATIEETMNEAGLAAIRDRVLARVAKGR
jgi:hypothetical protein